MNVRSLGPSAPKENNVDLECSPALLKIRPRHLLSHNDSLYVSKLKSLSSNLSFSNKNKYISPHLDLNFQGIRYATILQKTMSQTHKVGEYLVKLVSQLRYYMVLRILCCSGPWMRSKDFKRSMSISIMLI